jgi:kynurenine formamidase
MLFPYKIIDLCHTIEETTPTWDGSCGFKLSMKLEGDFCVNAVQMKAGCGTHIDAPAHRIPGGKTVDQIEDLLAPAIVIDAAKDLLVSDIEEFEQQHGQIPPGCFVLVRTGWERYWDQPDKYRDFPSVSEEAAKLLMARQMAGLGIDTLSPDRGDSGFPVHKIVLGAGKVIVENVANLGALPPRGWHILLLPMKMKGSTEAPVRLIGLLEAL